MDRQLVILMTRLEMLADAIRERDWQDTEFQFDRVLSVAQKMDGTRGRTYDMNCGCVCNSGGFCGGCGHAGCGGRGR